MRLIIGNTKLSTWHFLFAIFIFIKLTLDFLTPYRGVAYVVTNLGLYALILIHLGTKNRGIKIKAESIIEFIILVAFVTFQVILDADLFMLIKILSLYINFKILNYIFSNIDYSQLEKIGRSMTSLSILFFLIIYGFSYLTGMTDSRELGYFEHVNLLGNIIVFLVLGVIYFDMTLKYKLAVFLMGLLSMSTGSLLLSMLVFIPIRKINVKTSLIYLLLSLVIFYGLFVFIELKFPELYNKLFGVFSIFENMSFSDFFDEVSKGTSIHEISSGVESSFSWRVYAWVKYYSAIVNSGWESIIFGNGVLSYKEVWEEIMPHNDYILMVYDFGLIFYFFMMPLFLKFIRRALNDKVIFFIGLLFLVRLGVENVIYSYYTFFIFIFQFALIKNHYARKKSLHNSDVPAQ